MTDEPLRELQRARWRRYREAQRLVDPTAEDCARGGLGRGVSELSVRLLVLPGDPERDTIDFNPRLWAWLKSELESPFPGSVTDWGRHFTPTAAAAVRGLRVSQDKWDSYFAIHRNGGLEMALGPDGGGYVNERRAFWLLRVVGRIWAAIHGYEEAVRQFGVEGPFECTVALTKTAGAAVGHFASGWADPGTPFWNGSSCLDPNLLFRRELETWPGAEPTAQLACAVGAWIEDSFGSPHRRFLARSGSLSGQFDWQRYD